MGAFGNYPYNHKQTIDFDKLNVVPVAATFNVEGKIRPDYFGYVNPDKSVEKFKVEIIKYTREYDNPSRILFCCTYKNYGKMYEVNLVFYAMERKWIIQ